MFAPFKEKTSSKNERTRKLLSKIRWTPFDDNRDTYKKELKASIEKDVDAVLSDPVLLKELFEVIDKYFTDKEAGEILNLEGTPIKGIDRYYLSLVKRKMHLDIVEKESKFFQALKAKDFVLIDAFVANHTPLSDEEKLKALLLAVLDPDIEVSKKLIKLLVQKVGANINAKPDNGVTALHSACNMGNIRVAMCLMDLGADITITSKAEQTPLDLVLEFNDVISLCLKAAQLHNKATLNFCLKHLAKRLCENSASLKTHISVVNQALSVPCLVSLLQCDGNHKGYSVFFLIKSDFTLEELKANCKNIVAAMRAICTQEIIADYIECVLTNQREKVMAYVKLGIAAVEYNVLDRYVDAHKDDNDYDVDMLKFLMDHGHGINASDETLDKITEQKKRVTYARR